MKIVVILVHGYNVTNPERTVNKFRQYFEQMECLVESFTYGYVPFTWQVKKRNPAIAKRLSKRILHWSAKGFKVVVVNHSNGAALTYLASLYGAAGKVWRVLSIHPALTKSTHPYESAERVIVVYNRGDMAVIAGKWLSRIIKFFTPDKYYSRPWGSMGNKGFQGEADNVLNCDTGNDQVYHITAHGHSDEFTSGKEEYFLPLFSAQIIGRNVITKDMEQ